MGQDTVTLPHPSAVERFLTAPVGRWVMPAFRRFFVLKIVLWHILHYPGWITTPTGAAVTASVIGGAALALTRRFAWLGLLLMVPGALYELVLISFPIVPNHYYVEALALLILVIFYAPSRSPEEHETNLSLACHTLQAVTLLFWFYAGVQKAVQGYWMNGEYLAISGLYQSGTNAMSYTIQTIFGPLLGTEVPNLDEPEGLGATPIEVSAGVVRLFFLLCWATIITEMALPILAPFRRTRPFAITALIMLQIVVSGGAGIYSFGFTGVGLLLLFFPRVARTTYGILIAFMVLFFVVGVLEMRGIEILPFAWM